MLTSKKPLRQYDGFRASNLDDLLRVVESNLGAKLLQAPKTASIDAFANSCKLPTSQLWFCSYGAPISLQFADGDYVRVQFAHTGTGQTLIGTTPTSITATQCCISPADAIIEFAEAFQQIVWRVDAKVLTRKLGTMLGIPITRKLNFKSALALDAHGASSLSFILNCILVHLAKSNPRTRPFVLEELEQAFIVSLLCNGDHNLRHLLDGPAPPIAPRQVRRVEEYIEANWAMPLRIEDMAAVAGSSARSIYRAFRNSRGYSPMEFVKRQRLLQARALLLDPNAVITVTQAAIACGFSDVSRFSKDFSEAYGEPPSKVRGRPKKRSDGA